MINSSYLDISAKKQQTWIKDSLLVIAASFLISLFACISFPLPFTPVPFATQAQVILCLAFALGSKRATAAVFLYLCQGALGLPVFAGATAGFVVLIGAKGGYLFGYLVAAFITGYIAERMREKTAMKAFLAMAVGNGLILLFGALGLAYFIGWQQALLLGVAPFLVGDVLKLIVATRGLKACRLLSSI